MTALAVLSMATLAQAVPFTYQGQLKDQGVPFHGTVDLRFALKGDADGDVNLAGPVEYTGVRVDNGLFTLPIEFAGYSFDGTPTYLEVAVRSDRDYETLAPLQQITAAPFAMYALEGPGGDGSGGSLDDAYDHGGAGTGREITADAGAVRIAGNDGLRVDAGIVSGPVSIRRADEHFDVQVRKGIGLGGVQPQPARIGCHITKGSLLSPIEDWAYLSVSTSGHSLRRKSGTDLTFDVADDPNAFDVATEQMTLTGAGNVGIGTTNPLARLHLVDGTDTELGQGGFLILGYNANRNISIDNNEIMARDAGYISDLYLNNNGGDVIVSGSGGGNLGIGTSAPKQRLHVNGDYYGRGHLWLHAYEGDGASGTAYVQARDSSSGSSVDLQFRTKSGSSAVDVMRLRSNGRVGIGTTNPSKLLHVNGTARVNVLEITGGADLSEGFDVAGEDVQPGMVVSIDPANPGRLVPSRRAYDRKVAGIVSGAGGVATGMLMGQSGSIANGAHPVALSGRVYCLVDAADRAIEPGDLLTTSSTPGHAMKVTNHSAANGAILGKAMTAMKKGQRGLVLVLVGLQ